jgi:hypothetical protein
MLNRRWLLFLFVVTLQLARAQSSPPIPDNTLTDSKLQLTIKTERNVLRMSDTLEMETRLTNWGNKDSYIWEEDMCWNPARGLSMRVMTSAGKDVQGPSLLDCLPPPPREGDAYQFGSRLMPFMGRSTDSRLQSWRTNRASTPFDIQQLLVSQVYCGDSFTRSDQQTLDCGHAYHHVKSNRDKREAVA